MVLQSKSDGISYVKNEKRQVTQSSSSSCTLSHLHMPGQSLCEVGVHAFVKKLCVMLLMQNPHQTYIITFQNVKVVRDFT